MKMDLDANIDNIYYILYMLEQEEKEKKLWRR